MNNVKKIKISLPISNNIINEDRRIKISSHNYFRKNNSKRIHYPLISNTITCDPAENKIVQWPDYSTMIWINRFNRNTNKSTISPQNERQYSSFLPQNLPLKAKHRSNSRSSINNYDHNNSDIWNAREISSPLTNSRIVSWT